MTQAAREAQAPIFFFQAQNDYSLAPSQSLSAAMKEAGHSFAYLGGATWEADVMGFLDKHCAR